MSKSTSYAPGIEEDRIKRSRDGQILAHVLQHLPPWSFSRNEGRILHRLKENHFYLLQEIVGGTGHRKVWKNDYKYVQNLIDKQCLNYRNSATYLPVARFTDQESLKLVKLTEIGAALRTVLRDTHLVERQTKTGHLFITPNDFRVLIALHLAAQQPKDIRQLTTLSLVSLKSIEASVRRLQALKLIEHTARYRLTGDGQQFAAVAYKWLTEHNNGSWIRQTPADATETIVVSKTSKIPDLPQLITQCRRILQILMGLKPRDNKESVLILGDTATHHIATLFAIACDMLEIEHTFVIMPPQAKPGVVPKMISAAINEATVLLAITTESVTYAEPIRNRLEEKPCGFRVASLPSPEISWLTEKIITDPCKLANIREESEQVADMLRRARTIRIRSPLGTDLVVRLNKNTPIAIQDGSCNTEGEKTRYPKRYPSTNLIAGEVWLEPETADGIVVVDGPVDGVPLRNDPRPFKVRIVDGEVVEVEGPEGPGLRKFKAFIEANPENRWLSSLNIGTNRYLVPCGDSIVDNKVRGNINLGFGCNTFVSSSKRLDSVSGFILYRTDVIIDDGAVVLHLDAQNAQLKTSGRHL